MARASFPVSSSLARSKRLPVKRPASSRTRTATAAMSATATCADADLGDVLFDFVLAVEVRNPRLSVGGADGSKPEMHACCFGRVGGSNTLSYFGVCAVGRHRHREERGRSFE